MATTDTEQQRAAKLAWDRRQAAGLNQKQGDRGLRSPAAQPQQGMSARNALSFLKNRDQRKPLEQELRGRAGEAVGAALATYVGMPTVGRWLGKKGAESKPGKWVVWGVIYSAVISLCLLVLIVIATFVSICQESLILC